MSPQALAVLGALREQTPESPWAFPTTRGSVSGHRETIVKAVADVRAASGVDFVPHDLRRTVATFLTGELNVPRLVVSKLLNHVEAGVTRMYDRASYDNEKKRALDAWARRLETIITGDLSAKVVALRA